jgi:hypothetical protein
VLGEQGSLISLEDIEVLQYKMRSAKNYMDALMSTKPEMESFMIKVLSACGESKNISHIISCDIVSQYQVRDSSGSTGQFKE